MKYAKLPLSCHCGRPAGQLEEVGLTENHQLVVHWRCPQCQKHLYMVKPLVDCWEACPDSTTTDTPEFPLLEGGNEFSDEAFLHSLGVRFPDER